MKIAKTIIFSLMGLMMLNSGLNKFFQYLPMPEMTPEQAKLFDAFNTITWLMPLVGFAEVLGGILVLIPRTRALGALVLFPVIIGIMVHHLVMDPSTILIGGIILLVDVWILYTERHKLMPLIDM
ncbi:MAG: DoxX family protein [Saprospiraceae bacterium]|nr:DoxX family protein [Saprospiraceae bacterium]